MAPGTSLSFFARVTSDALTAGSTCTANALSRQITFTKAGSVAAASVPTLGTLGLVLLAGLVGVAAYRNQRVRGALNVLLPVIAIAALSLGSAPSLNAQATDPNTTYAGSVNDAIQSVRAVVDAAGNVGVTGTRAVSCVGAPLTLLSENLPFFDLTGSQPKTGTLTVSRPILSGAAISASYVEMPLRTTVTLGSILVTANGSSVLNLSYITPITMSGRSIRLSVVIDGQTIETATYEML